MRQFYALISGLLIFFSAQSQAQTTHKIILDRPGSGSWVVPCGVSQITVEVWGAGGGGGAAWRHNKNSGGGGGGGGAYKKATINVGSVTSFDYTVGSGGRGGYLESWWIFETLNDGENGGSSAFHTFTAIGGNGGESGDNGAGNGGNGAIGDRNGGKGGNGSGSYGAGGGGGAGSGGHGQNGTVANPGGGDGGSGLAPDGTSGGKGGNRQSGNGVGNNAEAPGGGGGGARRSSNGNSDGGRGGDGLIIITYVSNSSTKTYCEPSHSRYVEPITLVQFAGISRTSSASTNSDAFETFCDEGIVEQGKNESITLKGNTNDGWFSQYTNHFTVFIDWNNDGVFSGSNEIQYIGSITGSTGTDSKTLTGVVNVPNNAVLGVTKMRIRKAYSKSQSENPCNYIEYGQTEDYIILVKGSCKQPTSALANGSGNLTICEEGNVVLTQQGGELGYQQTWKWYKGTSPAAANLINENTNNNASYTITSLAAGTYTYYVRAEGGNCGTGGQGKTVTVTVNAKHSISWSSGDQNLTSCSGVSINPVVYRIGGSAAGASISWSPSKPAGVIETYNSLNKTYTLSGSPTGGGVYNYTLSTTGDNVCETASISGSITLSSKPANLSYTQSNVTYCSGGPIAENKPTVSGTLPVTYSISGTLPAGLTMDPNTGIISGTPAGAFVATNFIITATNGCGFATQTIKIAVSTGDQAFNITPTGTQNICSDATPIHIGLNGSVDGVLYRLYRDGQALVDVQSQGGGIIDFGSFNQSGVYTATSVSSCATNMIGNFTINVTPRPTTTFTYSNYTFCKSGLSPVAQKHGTTSSGTFSATPEGLVFEDSLTGVINLGASEVGKYTITYTVAAGGGCDTYSYILNDHQIEIASSANVYSVIGGGDYCEGTGGVEIGLEKSQNGVTYQLLRNGQLVSPLQEITGDGNEIFFVNRQTVAGIYSVQAKLGACTQLMDGETEVIVNPSLSNIKITPSSTTICQGTVVPLTASLASQNVVTNSVTVTNNNSMSIPDNNAAGTFQTFKVTGIPEGATITGVSLNYRVTHQKTNQLIINLKGPNGNVLNIANKIGAGTGQNFGSSVTNTTVNSSAAINISAGSNPYNDRTYAPHGAGAIQGASSVPNNKSNVTTFSGLYGATSVSANGTWILSVTDIASGYSGNLNNCQLVITYTLVNGSVPVLWYPVEDLYTDPNGTVPYQEGSLASVVYAKPSSGVKTYQAMSRNPSGCSTTASTTLTVNASPNLTVKADYCASPGTIRITASSDISISNWLWNTGKTAGSSTSSFIDVKEAGVYYVSAKASGYSCAATGTMSVAQELVTNGDFELGNNGFTSGYYYQEDDPDRTNELYDDKNPSNNGYGVGKNGRDYHNNFWGVDHTYGTGDGSFMIVNGHGNIVVWKSVNVSVLPNTEYYFSGWGMSLNADGNNAILEFKIDGDGQYLTNNIAYLENGVAGNTNSGWKQFYGRWKSGPATTSVNLSIINHQTALGGNDFGIDDISFATLSTFFTQTSDEATANQTGLCNGTPIKDITYEVGGNGEPPLVISGALPPGLKTYWNGRDYRIYGTPSQPGSYPFTLQSQGCAQNIHEVLIETIPASSVGTFEGGSLKSVCYGSSGNIEVNNSVGNLTWQVSDDKVNWTAVSNGSFTNLESPKYYRVTAKNTGACEEVTSAPIKLAVKNLWIGKTNTQWNEELNWSDESVPTMAGCDEVIIPQVNSNYNDRYPILTNGQTVAVGNLFIKADALVTIQQGALLSVSGTITGNGKIDAVKGSIQFDGNAEQVISSKIFKDTTISKLLVSNPGWLKVIPAGAGNQSLAITDKISFSNDGKLNSGNNITLKSSYERTASVGEVGGESAITGQFTVERYLNIGTDTDKKQHGKKWMFLATPAQGQSIKNTWMEGGVYTQGFGIQIPNNVGSGWDAGTVYAPTIKSYDHNTDAWVSKDGLGGPLDANDQLYNERGWMVFVRGDRSVTGSTQAATNTNLRSKGTLLTGTKRFTVPMKSDGFYAIGNPYASAVDARKVEGLGTDGTFYVWNPNLGGVYGYGAYQIFTYDSDKKDYVSVPGKDTINNYILSGQAIFVQTSPSSAYDIVFTESAKGTTTDNVSFYRPAGLSGRSSGKLRTNLYGNGELIDGTLQFFSDDYSNAIDNKDGRKLLNSGVNLSVKTQNKLLGVERKQTINKADTIFFNLSGIANGTYRFDFDASNLAAPGLEAWLEDAFTQQRTPVSLEGETNVEFEVSAAAASKAANRFRIVFKPAAPLPVTFVKVEALNEGGQVNVKWTVANEINLSKYVVMKSTDGTNFTDMADVAATGLAHYAAMDQNAVNGYNYYRIRSVDRDGSFAYSEIAKVWVGHTQPMITVFPNPVVNGVINLKLENMPKGKYSVRLVNPGGQVMLTQVFDHAGGNYTQKIPWDYKMAHGHYKLEVTQPDGGLRIITVMY